MTPERLQDAINRRLGKAALRSGEAYDVYRPAGADWPLDPARRIIQLACALSAGTPKFMRQPVPGKPEWYAVMDAAYVQVGDYLDGPQGTFYVASLAPLAPPLVIRCDRVFDLMRGAEAPVGALQGYGGETRCSMTTLLRGWPASVLAGPPSLRGELPADTRGASWRVMLPRLPVAPRVADLLVDQDGTRLVVASAETTAEGWRLLAQQAEV